jgi:AP-1 complex subunit beta-1
MEKLEVMIKLCNEGNVDQVLLEFKEYAQEVGYSITNIWLSVEIFDCSHLSSSRNGDCQVDVDFVRRAVRAIGRAAIRLEMVAERCIRVLLDLISTKVRFFSHSTFIAIRKVQIVNRDQLCYC